MPKYKVTTVTTVIVEVEADTREEAINLAPLEEQAGHWKAKQSQTVTKVKPVVDAD